MSNCHSPCSQCNACSVSISSPCPACPQQTQFMEVIAAANAPASSLLSTLRSSGWEKARFQFTRCTSLGTCNISSLLLLLLTFVVFCVPCISPSAISSPSKVLPFVSNKEPSSLLSLLTRRCPMVSSANTTLPGGPANLASCVASIFQKYDLSVGRDAATTAKVHSIIWNRASYPRTTGCKKK